MHSVDHNEVCTTLNWTGTIFVMRKDGILDFFKINSMFWTTALELLPSNVLKNMVQVVEGKLNRE